MSAIQSPHNITYNGKEATEYIWLPALTVSGIEDHYKVVTDVNSQTQVTFAQQLDKITTRDSGCDPVYLDKQIVRSEKYWNPKGVEATLKQCYTDLYGSSFERLLRPGTERPNIKDTDIEKFILMAMVPAAARDFQRILQLGKFGIIASELTGGSGEVVNYNQVDGFWVKIIAAVVASKTPRYTISENAASTKAGQVLAAGRGRIILQNVYDNQPLVMMQTDDQVKFFEVTRAVYNNYYAELEANQALESNRAMLVNGTKVLSYRGVPLKIMDVVDSYLQSDFTFGTGANQVITNPHRVVMSVKDNMQVALDTPTNQPIVFDTWDEKKEKRWYARAMYMLDTQIAVESLMSVAY